MTTELSISAGAPTLRYFSYDSKHGEPRIIAKAAVAAASTGIDMPVESHHAWVTYRKALLLDSFCDVFSTHGWSNSPIRFQFSRQRPEEDRTVEWKTPGRHVTTLGAQVFVVLACSGQVAPWLSKLRPGSVVITSSTKTISSDECADAIADFIPTLPGLRASSASPQEVWAAWPSKHRFQFAVA
ncbi:MAG: hypothetical protein J0I18_19360 [Actinobacteria bacterium]|nr:hypothetical protein [Actinomycetota bacterium]